ncbi:MAG TPA: dTMP kinase [Oscillospiraceae bacterium]|nr:dTMP kinase [Oscillospiraceae bacterium]
MTDQRGFFIVLEGLDGSGKSTQAKLLAEHLRAKGREVCLTAEPTESRIGAIIREALSGGFRCSPEEMAALFLADRIRHNADPESGIRQSLERGVDVVCDRYYYSSFAYQGMETDPDWVLQMNLGCPAVLRPDLCVFYDLDPETCFGHLRGSRERFEIFETDAALIAKTREQFERVFAMLKGRENIVRVDAGCSIEEVGAETRRVVDGFLEQNG